MIGVRDALAMRTVLAEHLNEHWYRREVLGAYMSATSNSFGHIFEGGIAHTVEMSPKSIDMLAEKFLSSLRVAEIYTLSDDMMTFAEQAGRDLPDDYVVEAHHLHAQHGLLCLPRGLADMDGNESVRMLSWHHGQGASNRTPTGEWQPLPGVEINLWGYWRISSDHRPETRVLAPVGSDFQPYGMGTIGYDDRPDEPPSLSSASRLVYALQMLMRQELPALTRQRMPRADVRQLLRLRLPVTPITVIELRRRAPSQETGTSGRHLTHRHYVRGTWAAYWVGPSHPQHPGGTEEKVRTYIYRAPHIRGPVDAPLLPTPARVHKITH